MRVISIAAGLHQIVLSLAGAAGSVTVREHAPTVGTRPGRLLAEFRLDVEGGRLELPRFDGGHDRLYSAFFVWAGDECADGVRYVTDLPAALSDDPSPYPAVRLKALHATPEDIAELGIGQTTFNISLPGIMTLNPTDGDIEFTHDGRAYYFIKEKIDEIDAHMSEYTRLGVVATLILLNSPRLFGATGERALLDAAIHPNYDWACDQAYISAFDMRTENGQNLYRAFVEFLADRYAANGPVGGAIISNEVDSQYVWGNAGEMPVNDYAHEYCQAMRLAFLCGRRRAAKWRVYASLDHYWCGLAHDLTKPLRYYPGRAMLDGIRDWSEAEGDFPWCVAHHPYPENLNWPDFWRDRSPNFTFSTPRITFMNMEVLPAYLAQPKYLYRGEPRRIIFSEQGFNSHDGALRELTEKMGEAGYVLAYLKTRALPTVDMLFHHSYVDNPHEFGLNLGIRRYDETQLLHAGEPKRIWYAVRDMDTPREPDRVAQARSFIGAELFDYLLNPPLVNGERDTARDAEFG